MDTVLAVRRVRSLIATAFVIVSSGWCSLAIGGLQGEIKAHEVRLLPEYCPHTLTFVKDYGSPEGQQQWQQRLGPPYHAMHHYCWALIARNRAARFGATPQERRHNYNSVVSDIEFVLRHADDTFALMPEILTRRAEAYVALKEFANADRDLRRALSIRPDYWPAYAELAESLATQGKRTDAFAVLKDGISKVSEPRMLQRMLDDMKRDRR